MSALQSRNGLLMSWRVQIALVVLSLVPLLGGVVRLSALASHSHAAADARFIAAPGPILIHLFAATLFSILGAFQFSDELRRRAPRWHRLAGRVLAACGLLAGVTGIWMTVASDIPRDLQGPLLLATRLVVGVMTVVGIVLAWRAILRRDVPTHEAWMIRAYALGQGAGAQVLFLGVPAVFLGGELLGLTRDVLMLASWAFNALLAEVIIRRRAQPRTSSVAAASTGSAALRAS